ncbi:MAG: protein kinase domain-containing protein, partial [Pirellula sp.]
KGMIHRDIKPANILLDKTDRPYLADFGIALRETDQTGAGEIAGTPAYMSPEQARGEGHLMTNQSDIFSLGVVLYELLAGRRPFRAKTAHELIRMVQTTEIRTPRTFDATISRELERVCLKALARRPSDRFAIAKDFADEVRYLVTGHVGIDPAKGSVRSSASSNLSSSNSDRISSADAADPRRTPSELPSAGQLDADLRSGPVRVIPKGLRSFDEKDSEFFLELLPGPFDRSGLPEGLRFWKNRIEAIDIDESFRIGLVYGPSGCGKSSLMKAGLLPRLSPKIESIYIEATPEDTTGKLLREIQKRIPEASGATLAEALSIIRRRKLVPSGGKLLLVIDQFEQWLYAHKNYADAELTNALRQCDGVTIQAIVMVRDDFWLSVSRFLRELDVPIVERENSALVDLFDLDHARKVLALFGRAYDKLPEDRTAWTQEQKEFLQQAVEGLSQEEKVISVRLALFAEMMKSKTWAPKTLADLGGIAGVGVTFLEETFGDKHAPIQFRQHQEGVRSLLGSLLPAVGTNIKGHSRSVAELQKVVGYEDQPREFAELVGLLDKNLRLITPADDSQQSQQESRSYQLTHDYLVPSLREWLNQKQRETKKGRAELKLAERAATWRANQENKQLPTLWEWMQIRRWTEPKRWVASEQAVMQKAGRIHLRNWGSALLATLLAGAGIGFVFQQQNLRSQQEKITVALDSLQKTLGPAVPVNIDKLLEMKRSDRIRSDLASRFAAASQPREKLSLAFALAHFGQVEVDYLISQIDEIEDRDTANLINALRNDMNGSTEKLRQAASRCSTPELQRRKARLALAALGIGDTALAIDAC